MSKMVRLQKVWSQGQVYLLAMIPDGLQVMIAAQMSGRRNHHAPQDNAGCV